MRWWRMSFPYKSVAVASVYVCFILLYFYRNSEYKRLLDRMRDEHKRTVLTMSLKSQFMQFERIPNNRAWNELFQKLNLDTSVQLRKKNLSTKFASTCGEKNRYTNVLPYDSNRIVLSNGVQDGCGEYINASPVDVVKAHRKYILTQGPVPTSVEDFWQMVYENNVPLIVMLNRLLEGQSSALKCEKYYPCSENPKVDMGAFTIHLVSEDNRSNFVVRNFKVYNNEESPEPKDVIQVQYTEWPDFGVPASTAHFLEMLEFVKEHDLLSTQQSDPPVVVHCSAGIGRSGTFVLVDSVIRMLELGVKEEDISIQNLLLDIRCQRYGLIQTPDQLKFAWLAIIDFLDKHGSGSKSESAPVNPPQVDTPAADVSKKRRSESHEESLDERLTKRREMVYRMVEKSRRAEQVRHRSSSIGNGSPFSPVTLFLGGAVAVSAVVAYYLYNNR